jgi:hypothetical protein
MLIFAGVAYVIALTDGDAGSHLIVRMVIELPVFLLIAGGLAWSLALAGMAANTFSFTAQLQPAHAIALAAAWLLGGNRQTA